MFFFTSGARLAVALLLLWGLASCASENRTAKRIVDQAMEKHRSEKLKRANVSFTFRDREYRAERHGGRYAYHRIFTDSTGNVHDVLTNNSFTRHLNGVEVELSEKDRVAFTSSINSVIYFALLPYALNDAAVRKEHVGQTTIKGEPYDQIRVTFRKEGGGEDHTDVYVYWFHRHHHTLDYLAYSYQVNEGGTRFREAINRREVNGILFQDYINYKTDSLQLPLTEYGRLFEQGNMQELSRIINESLEVTLF